MSDKRLMRTLLLPVALAAVFASGVAVADRPPWAGHGDEGGYGHGGRRGAGQDEEHGGRGREARYDRREDRFDDHRRILVRDYYARELRRGGCPPGLARKHNGCVPPGLARRWRVGRPLPPDLVRYDLPPALVVQLGVPPPGYRYVRVASDILMIAAGTNMVVDAVNDLGQR